MCAQAPFEKELREQLLLKFDNITDAFVGLDVDNDNKLKRQDFLEGLRKHDIWLNRLVCVCVCVCMCVCVCVGVCVCV